MLYVVSERDNNMNEKTALNKGYETTGIYSFNKSEVEPRCAALRAAGYKALVVFVPNNPLSRGHRSGGWAVVVEPRYRKDKMTEQMSRIVTNYQTRCDGIKAHYAEEMAKAIATETASMEEAKAWLAANSEIGGAQ